MQCSFSRWSVEKAQRGINVKGHGAITRDGRARDGAVVREVRGWESIGEEVERTPPTCCRHENECLPRERAETATTEAVSITHGTDSNYKVS